MKCNQSRTGFELVSPCPFPTMITITPRAPPKMTISLAVRFTWILKMRDNKIKALLNRGSFLSDHLLLYIQDWINGSRTKYIRSQIHSTYSRKYVLAPIWTYTYIYIHIPMVNSQPYSYEYTRTNMHTHTHTYTHTYACVYTHAYFCNAHICIKRRENNW